MLWKIAKKEFLLNLMTFKFAVGTIVCVVLTAIFMPVPCRSERDGVQPSMWRTIVKSRITKLTAAAVITIAVVFSVSILDTSMHTASAAEILAEAVEAVSNLKSVHIKAQIRTTAHDNFELIGLDYDFVPNEMWKEFDKSEVGRCRWRIEKLGRVVVMDGEGSLLLIRPNQVAKDGKGHKRALTALEKAGLKLEGE